VNLEGFAVNSGTLNRFTSLVVGKSPLSAGEISSLDTDNTGDIVGHCETGLAVLVFLNYTPYLEYWGCEAIF
jgi:hypothetical protein